MPLSAAIQNLQKRCSERTAAGVVLGANNYNANKSAGDQQTWVDASIKKEVTFESAAHMSFPSKNNRRL